MFLVLLVIAGWVFGAIAILSLPFLAMGAKKDDKRKAEDELSRVRQLYKDGVIDNKEFNKRRLELELKLERLNK